MPQDRSLPLRRVQAVRWDAAKSRWRVQTALKNHKQLKRRAQALLDECRARPGRRARPAGEQHPSHPRLLMGAIGNIYLTGLKVQDIFAV